MNELPISLSDENKDAPITSSSGGEFVALLGLLGTTIVALLIWFFAGGFSVLSIIALTFLFACVVVIPSLDYVRGAIVCDAEGLSLGLLWSKRHADFAEIEDLVLLCPPDDLENSGSPMIMVDGKPIHLEVCEPTRQLLMQRIEREVGGSMRFIKRDSVWFGWTMKLPQTFNYSDDARDLRRFNRGLAGVLSVYVVALLLLLWWLGAQWVPLHLWIGWRIAVLIWNVSKMCRFDERRQRMLERQDESIFVDEAGLRFRSKTRDLRLDWNQITRLERDCAKKSTDPIYRVEGAGQTISFRDFHRLAELLSERCQLKWEESPHLRRLAYGITRQGETLSVRADNKGARMQKAVWQSLWHLATLLSLWSVLSDAATSATMLVESLFSCLLPPIGILLYLRIATTTSLRRVVTACDENGITHQGWFARRTIPWDEIETCDLSILWIRLRARNGHVMRISHWPLFGNARARRELYAEIRCRAPHAHGDWKTDD